MGCAPGGRRHEQQLSGTVAVGMWGSFVVCRSEQPLDDVTAIIERDDGLSGYWTGPSGWQVGEYPGSFIVDDAAQLLVDLVAETSAPALTGFVMDSDCVDIQAHASKSGSWRACLDRAAMASYLAEDGTSLADRFLAPADAAQRARQWAEEAGLSASPYRLEHLFGDAHADPLAEDLFFGLLTALGLEVEES
jgi:hypothetical protein